MKEDELSVKNPNGPTLCMISLSNKEKYNFSFCKFHTTMKFIF